MKRLGLLIFLLFGAGSLFMGWLYFKQWDEGRKSDSKFNLTSLVQTGSAKGKIPSDVLAHMIGLNASEQRNLYLFDCREAEKKLKSCPRIDKVSVTCVKPSIVTVDYSVKRPIAIIKDFEMCALSEKGEQVPYWEELRLPSLYIGDSKKYLSYVEELLQVFPEADAEFDLSRLNREFAEREIIVILHIKPPLYLRFNPEKLSEGLLNYKRLVGHLEPQGILPQTIDLRSSKLAFITELEERK